MLTFFFFQCHPNTQRPNSSSPYTTHSMTQNLTSAKRCNYSTQSMTTSSQPWPPLPTETSFLNSLNKWWTESSRTKQRWVKSQMSPSLPFFYFDEIELLLFICAKYVLIDKCLSMLFLGMFDFSDVLRTTLKKEKKLCQA